jgi:hypothetical protein
MVKIALRDLQTNNRKIVFSCATSKQAIDVAAEMNRLNAEAARLTGTAIRFVYMILYSGS